MGRLGFVKLQLLAGHNGRVLPELVGHGDYDDDLLDPYGYDNEFTATHFFRREELVSLLGDNGVTVSAVTGLEGLGSVFHDAETRERIHHLDGDDRDAVERSLARLRHDPSVADLSVHVLARGRA